MSDWGGSDQEGGLQNGMEVAAERRASTGKLTSLALLLQHPIRRVAGPLP